MSGANLLNFPPTTKQFSSPILILICVIIATICGHRPTAAQQTPDDVILLDTSNCSAPLRNFVVNPRNGDVIVGGSDRLYRFRRRGDNLTTSSSYNYARGSCGDDAAAATCDVMAKVVAEVRADTMIVDAVNGFLVVCGNRTSGFCFRHSLADICAGVTALNRGGADDQMYVSGGGDGAGVGFMLPHAEHGAEFYFARTVVAVGQQSLSCKRWTDDFGGFRLRDSVRTRLGVYIEGTMLTVQPGLIGANPLYFHYGFAHGGFAYFLFTETVKLGVSRSTRGRKKKAKYAIKIGRICTDDDIFTSYVEIQLKCLKESLKSKNLVVIDAQLVDSTLDLVGRYSTKGGTDPYLIVLYGVSNDADPHPDGGKRFLCVYPLKDINGFLDSAIYKCNKLRSVEDEPGVENPLRKYPTYPGKYPPAWTGTVTCADEFDPAAPEPAMCPDSQRRNTYYVIAGAYPLERKSAFEQWNYAAFDSSLFTCFLHLRRHGDVIVVLGGRDGRVYLHSSVHHQQMRFLPYVEIGSRAITKLHYDVTADSLLVMDARTLRRVAIERFCGAAASCGECLQRTALGCGYCSATSSCAFATSSSCAAAGEWTQTECYARVRAVRPASGPRQGATNFAVLGENLACASSDFDAPVPLWGISPNGEEEVVVASCAPKWSGTEAMLSCESKLQNSTFTTFELFINTSLNCDGDIRMIGPGRRAVRSDVNFTFVDVQVDSYHPRHGIEGTLVTVQGLNLHHSKDAVVAMSGRSCKIGEITATEITCVVEKTSKNSPVVGTYVRLDGYKKVWSEAEGFKMMPEPEMDPISTHLRSIVSGGCEYILSGRNFNSTSSNVADISKDGRKYYDDVKLKILNNTHLIFTVPSFQSISHFNNGSFVGEKDIKVTFRMDGYKYKFKTFAIFPDTRMQMDGKNKYKVEDGFVEFTIIGFEFAKSCPKDNFQFYLTPEYPCGVADIHCETEMVTNAQGNFINLKVKEEIFSSGKIGTQLDMSVKIGATYIVQLGTFPLTLSAATPPYVIVIILIFVTLLSVGLLWWWRNRKKKKSTEMAGNSGENPEELTVLYDANNQNDYHHTNATNNRHDDDDDVNSLTMVKRLEISEEIRQEIQPVLIKEEKLKINFDKIIGKGHFGTVYEGWFVTSDREERVAVKTLSRIEDISSIEKFLQEGLIMRGFCHENVLTLVGICMEIEQPLVVLPYMEHGDLLRFIRDPSNSPTVKDLVWFGIQACKGMEYLSSKRFVHRDLAARNCMLDSNLLVKVADFGLARDIYEKEYYKIDVDSKRGGGVRMPIKWMALESLMEQKFTTRSDVWSFGVLLWELMTRGVTPYPDVDAFDMLDYLQEGRRLRQAEFCPDQLYHLMLNCWNVSEEVRPTFHSLVSELQHVYEAIDGSRQLDFGVEYVNTSQAIFPCKTSTNGPVLPPRNFSISNESSKTSPEPSEPSTSRMMSYDDDDVIVNHDHHDGSTVDDDHEAPMTSPNRVVASMKQFPKRTESYDQEGYLMPDDVTNKQRADDVTTSPHTSSSSSESDEDDERRYENVPLPPDGTRNRLLPLQGDVIIDNRSYTPMTGSLRRDHQVEKIRSMTSPPHMTSSSTASSTDDETVYTKMGI